MPVTLITVLACQKSNDYATPKASSFELINEKIEEKKEARFLNTKDKSHCTKVFS